MDTKELVERLRTISSGMTGHVDSGGVWDAADALERAEFELAALRARMARLEEAVWFARDHLAYTLAGPFGTMVEASLIAKIDAALIEEPKP